jgi:hypothetical protein
VAQLLGLAAVAKSTDTKAQLTMLAALYEALARRTTAKDSPGASDSE